MWEACETIEPPKAPICPWGSSVRGSKVVETSGMIVADKETYGANLKWCLLKPIPIELDDDSEDETVGQAATRYQAGPSSNGIEIEPLD